MLMLRAGYHYTRQQLDQFPDPDEAHARRGAYWTFDGAAFVEKMRELHAKGMQVRLAACAEYKLLLL